MKSLDRRTRVPSRLRAISRLVCALVPLVAGTSLASPVTGPGEDHSGEDHSYQSFESLTLDGSLFVGTNLYNSRFFYSSLSGVDFSGANMESIEVIEYSSCWPDGCTFVGANLDRAEFSYGGGFYGDFTDASMRNMRAEESGFANSTFLRADLTGSSFFHGEFTGRVSLRDSDFTDATLQSVHCTDCQLRGSSFQGANLIFSTIWSVEANAFDYIDMDLRNATLAGARWRMEAASFDNFVATLISDASTTYDENTQLVRVTVIDPYEYEYEYEYIDPATLGWTEVPEPAPLVSLLAGVMALRTLRGPGRVGRRAASSVFTAR